MLPLSFAILRLSLRHDEIDAPIVMAELANDYGRSRQFTGRAIAEQLMTAQVNGLLEEVGHGFDDDGHLVIRYRATQSGRALIARYIGA